MTRIVDLSQPFSPDLTPVPGYPKPRVEVLLQWGKDRINTWLVSTCMHVSTHMDLPLHVSSGGQDAAQFPLERCHGTGLVIDLSRVAGEWTILTRDLVRAALPPGEEIRRDDIVVFYTGWNRYAWFGEQADEDMYFCRHPGAGFDLVDWLAELNIKWVGIDWGGFDHPMNSLTRRFRPDLVREFEERVGKKVDEVFPEETVMYAHRVLNGRNIAHVDAMGGDIAQVAGRRCTLQAFPWRFVRGEGCIVRAVAFVED